MGRFFCPARPIPQALNTQAKPYSEGVKPIAPHAAKLLDAIWMISMGLFLGLTGAMVLSVILTFRGSRKIDASPGIEPFNDPRFAEYANEAVAGYIGQDLFMVGGTVALVLLGLAVLAHSLRTRIIWRLMRMTWRRDHIPIIGSRRASGLRSAGLFLCIACMFICTQTTRDMNRDWPSLYDTKTSEARLSERRKSFDRDHRINEDFAKWAWIGGFIALAISPWCRRVADTPHEEKK